MSQKIAVVTEDSLHLSGHFGMAPFYQVFTVEDGEVVAEEKREKPHHEEHPDHTSIHQPHDHKDMFAPITDCQVLICGGMGQPAYQKAQETGLEIIMTGGDIKKALDAYLQGQIASDLRRVHKHT